MRTLFTGVRMSSPACALGEYAHESFFVDVCLFCSAGYTKSWKEQKPDALCDRWRMAKTDARRRCSQELNAGRNELLYVYNMIPYSSFI